MNIDKIVEIVLKSFFCEVTPDLIQLYFVDMAELFAAGTLCAAFAGCNQEQLTEAIETLIRDLAEEATK